MSHNDEFSQASLEAQNRMCPTCGAGPMSPVRSRTKERTAKPKKPNDFTMKVSKSNIKYGPVNKISWFCPNDFGHTVVENI